LLGVLNVVEGHLLIKVATTTFAQMYSSSQ